MKRRALALIIIIIIASVLRLYKIGEVPPGVNRDEASIGYTAYSLLTTGRDEYGRFLPISFQSFGDWKLPLYIYTTIPFVKFLGMNEIAVRLPSALAGTLTVLLTYFLVLELYRPIKKIKSKIGNFALLSAFLLAVSPWHLHLSRVESESNMAVLFVGLGTLLFLKALTKPKHSWLYPTSFALFAFTYWTYHGNHIFTFLFFIVLFAIYCSTIPKTKSLFVGIAVFVALVGIILSQTLHEADKTKVSGISIFGDPTVVHTNIELPRNEHPNPNSFLVRLSHNRLTFAVETIARNYLKSFSPEFLFIKGGDNRAHNIENFGNMYLVEAPFLLLGVFHLIFTLRSKPSKLLLLWLLIAPIAPAITKDAPHTNRMFAIFPALSMTTALGIMWFLEQARRFRKLIIVMLLIAFIVNVTVYLERYYFHFPRNEAAFWGYGYRQLTRLLFTETYKNKKVVISHPEYSPYIFFLFYSSYDPAAYQREAVRYPPTADAFYHVARFGRFEFRPINWQSDVTPGTVIVDNYDEMPQGFRDDPTTKTIMLPSGEPLFTVASIGLR